MGQHKRKPKPTAEDRRRKRLAKEAEKVQRELGSRRGAIMPARRAMLPMLAAVMALPSR